MEIKYSDYIKYLKYDYRRYVATGSKNFWKILTFQGFWATFIFRTTSFIYFSTRRIPIINFIISVTCLLLLKCMQILTGISLPVGAKIGPGLYIGHYGLMLINGGLVMGRNCNLAPLTWIGGWGGPDTEFKNPVIGDRVWIGPDVKILRPVHIGNDVVIGMNSVVFDDIPDRAFVAGVPAKIIDYRGSFNLIFYDGMENDPERLASLEISLAQKNASQ